MSLQQLSDREFDRVLDDWIDEGPMQASDVSVDAALARVTTTAQRAPIRASWLSWPIARMQAMAVPAVIAAAVVALWAVLALVRPPSVGPEPSPPAVGSPEATPSATQIPSLATGSARIEVTGAAAFTEEWGFIQAIAIERIADLRLYQFYEFASTPCDCPGGRYLDLHLDPQDPDAYPIGAPIATGPSLVMRFGFPDNVYVDDDYMNAHVSDAGECTVTFTRFNEREIEGTFACTDVPSEVNEQIIDVAGEFSFDPRALPTAVPSLGQAD